MLWNQPSPMDDGSAYEGHDADLCVAGWGCSGRRQPVTVSGTLPFLIHLEREQGVSAKSENLSQNRIYRCSPLRVT